MKIKIFNPRFPIPDVFVDWFGYSFENKFFMDTAVIEEALEQPIKVACLPVFFDQYQEFKDNPFDHSLFDLLCFSDFEYFALKEINNWIEKNNFKNYILSVGSLKEISLPDDVIYKPWWSFNIVEKNNENYRELSLDTRYYDFDVLLGARRTHRDFVMAKLQSTDLLDRSIVTYRDIFAGEWLSSNVKLNTVIKKILKGNNLLFPYVSKNLKPEWEVQPNITKSVSDQVPWKIYDYTKYSIICETLSQSDGRFFMSEKTAKALFCKRIFIMFSTPLFLQNLRNLGFRTFNGILDESYDLEFIDEERFSLAFDQVNWLSKQSFTDIVNSAQEILDHNHNRLIEFKNEIFDKKQTLLYNKIKEKNVIDIFKK